MLPQPMHATCVTVRDPFHPAASREFRNLPEPCSIRSLASGIDAPHIILRNGEALLRADWDQPTEQGDILAVIILPQGGDGGSNPLQLVLMLAVMMVAPQLAWGIEGMLGANGIAVGASGLMAIQAGVVFAGMVLVNALIPPPKPTSPQQANSLAAPSPTYSLQAQGNLARIDQAIPVQYGRIAAYPDFAAQPYTEFAGNEQYLYQLLCLGQGEFHITELRIEDTPLENFAEIEYEVIEPGGSITLFPTNVISSLEVSGQEMAGKLAATYTRTGTTVTVTLAAHGYTTGRLLYLDFLTGGAADGAYTIATVAIDTFTVVTTASGTIATSNVEIQHYVGGFVANPSDSAANILGIDFVLPRGLYEADTGTGDLLDLSLSVIIEARELDSLGAPLGSWGQIGAYTYTARTTTPQRYSERLPVATGRYEVRVRRTDIKETDTAFGHEIIWAGLRAYLPETRDFGDVTLIALRMRASNNLSNQASRKINVICTRKIPTWNGVTWSAPVTTSSIAWAFADACRNTVYGGKLPDSRIDLAALLALDAIWAERGDEFNARFDSALSLWEALTKIAASGRAKPYMQGGIVRLARDSQQAVPVALYSMRNIVRGSFNIEYILPSDDTADAVEASYFDRNYWANRRVSCALSDSLSLKPAKIDLFGVTDREQAYREGLYQAASNRYRRRIIKFATEMEGFIPAFGDMIAIQHDMPAWGQFAEAVAWDDASRTLTLSEPMVWGPGRHYIGLRARDGSVDGPYRVTAGAATNILILSNKPTTTPYTGGDEERTHVVFGWADTWRQSAKVITVRPRGLYQVEIEAINEDPSVHTAETGMTAPPVQSSQLTTLYTSPVIADLTLRSSTSDPLKALLTWSPAPGADNYLIEMAAGVDPNDPALSWSRVGDTTANNFAVTAIYGAQTLIRVRAIGLSVGPWMTLSYGNNADYMWQPSANAMYTPSADPFWR